MDLDQGRWENRVLEGGEGRRRSGRWQAALHHAEARAPIVGEARLVCQADAEAPEGEVSYEESLE